MTNLSSMELWIAVLFMLNFVLVVFLFFVVRKVNRLTPGPQIEKIIQDHCSLGQQQRDNACQSAADIMEMVEPLVKEAGDVAGDFEIQIQEKKRLIRELNDALDSRIISINLLLSRADALNRKMEKKQQQSRLTQEYPSSQTVMPDQQNRIVEMYHQSIDMETIAQRLSIPKGEVQLVIDLKERFKAMESHAMGTDER